ncbi:GGDEF domain-containing protein [Paenibacillus sp. OAS669]|uniref:GGDEF domain-containing protein n=1 Tax=Paenibacillus sp. OAS669 TaxID=2663821 RepID=UPI00178C05D6|nr:diguanylate cyclase [Paenibacillus sp. OAS669]MBE1444887.1 diguanylate cyclase (GGDEF)-like protein [Paenibacillus sp. OAS669]
MRGFYNKPRTFFLMQACFFLFIIALCLYVTGFKQIPWTIMTLFASALIILMTSLLGGLLFGLGLSLAAMFVLGSVLLWDAFFSSALTFSIQEIVIWMIAIGAASIIGGVLHRWATTVTNENKEMNRKFDELVTIDEATGFDNKKRFYFELEEEFRRSIRTGTPFTLLLIRFKYLAEYERLYGQEEKKYLIKSLSDVLWTQTRISDRKFRLEDDTFAVILFNTGSEKVHFVLDKMEEQMKSHKLSNGKKEVTITISFGTSSFDKEFNDYSELIQLAYEELEAYTQ